MSQELSTAYQPAAIERRWYETWEKEGLFRARVNPDKKPYTIVIPPPNVTGALHMGHAFEHTLQDAAIRRARMMGYEALWLPGTDHAGIATQNVVERELAKEGLDRFKLGREKFVEKVWEWKEQYGGRILEQMKRLGNSCDWERERFTMDEGLSRAVRTVFVRWFDDGLIYRGNRIINWCPRCMTALSDVEVEHEDVAGEIVTFRYPLVGGSGHIAVSTTRVETMLGDTGIAVHPEDERYVNLVGQKVAHPFFPERDIPIVADDAVDPEFGTGAVKVTPAHDPTDFEIGERHDLEKINILNEQAHLTEVAGPFAGLDRYEARGKVFTELEKLGLVEKREAPYVHSVGHCYRCHTEIEPWLSEQWFVRMKTLAESGVEVVKNGNIQMQPERFVKSYIEWMENIRDWCISRQIWWGHRIPVWYCDNGHVFAAEEDPSKCKECGSAEITQDEDVLDTWFSSQLWPFSTLGWPDSTDDLEYFYPTALMAPGYEILYLWVARMIMSGLYFMKDVPFKEVAIHGIVRDFEGKKMSKSLGNVIDPLEIIERYGADALRWSLAFSAVPGNDSNASEDRIEGARNFANKLWNAARFVLMSVGNDRPPLPDASAQSIEDRWILARLTATIDEVERGLASFNWAESLKALHRFVWSEFCDWYIELAKLRFNSDRHADVSGVLVHVLDHILRLMHPVMPFITEELWSRLRPDTGSIMVAAWPSSLGERDREAETSMTRFQNVVVGIRRLRADHGIDPAKKMSVRVAAGDATSELESLNPALLSLARLEQIEFVGSTDSHSGDVTTITPEGVEVAVTLGDVIDLEVEKARLEKSLAEVAKEIARSEGKLGNEEFTSKAPGAVVEKERRKLADSQQTKEKIQAQMKDLG